MGWDEELEQLADYARAHFGDGEMKAAAGRALQALLTLRPGSLAKEAALTAQQVVISPHGDCYDLDTYFEALRHELRRLVTPH